MTHQDLLNPLGSLLDVVVNTRLVVHSAAKSSAGYANQKETTYGRRRGSKISQSNRISTCHHLPLSLTISGPPESPEKQTKFQKIHNRYKVYFLECLKVYFWIFEVSTLWTERRLLPFKIFGCKFETTNYHKPLNYYDRSGRYGNQFLVHD